MPHRFVLEEETKPAKVEEHSASIHQSRQQFANIWAAKTLVDVGTQQVRVGSIMLHCPHVATKSIHYDEESQILWPILAMKASMLVMVSIH